MGVILLRVGNGNVALLLCLRSMRSSRKYRLGGHGVASAEWQWVKPATMGWAAPLPSAFEFVPTIFANAYKIQQKVRVRHPSKDNNSYELMKGQ